MQVIDTKKLPYKIGDMILCEEELLTQGIIIGYFFFGGYNNYTVCHGYIIKLINSRVIGHAVGNHAYDAYGNKIIIDGVEGYWWVFPYKATLIRRNLTFMLTL